MRSILKILLVPIRGAVLFCIEECDERLRKSSLEHSFLATNGFKVRSWQYPEISDDSIYIIGSAKERDHFCFLHAPVRVSPEKLVELSLEALKQYVEDTLKISCTVFLQNGKFSVVEFTGRTPIFTSE